LVQSNDFTRMVKATSEVPQISANAMYSARPQRRIYAEPDLNQAETELPATCVPMNNAPLAWRCFVNCCSFSNRLFAFPKKHASEKPAQASM